MTTLKFYPSTQFPFARQLEMNWERIHAEFVAIQGELSSYVERDLYDEGWQVFGLWNLPHREPLRGVLERCPFTSSLIEEHVPRHGAAGFSVLEPGTYIKPHRGVQGDFLRCHLGLETPAGDCALSVDGVPRSWTAGETLIFDDRQEHSAWNYTTLRRVVLLLDFVP